MFHRSDQQTSELRHAVLIYGSARGGFATVHDVSNTDGKPVIKAGVPATRSALMNAMAALQHNDIAPEILPGHILAKGEDYLVWWRKPCHRQVWFRTHEFGECTAVVPHPSVLFMARPLSKEMFVFALNGEERPEPETPLYQAPYFNVWAGGRLCVGNVTLPSGGMAYQPEAWEDIFYASWFTHPNVQRLINYRPGAYAFWKRLLDGKEKKFPSQRLLKDRDTVGSAFKRIMKESE